MPNQEIVFSARDLASGKTLEVAASIETLRNKIRAAGGELQGVRQKTGEVEREWNKLTSGSEFLSEGLQSVRGLLNSIMWGTVIGGAAAAGNEILKYAFNARTAAIDTEGLNKGILSQGEKLGFLSKSQGELSKATVDLFNAELELAQFRAVRDRATRSEKIKQLEAETEASRKKNHEEGLLLEQMREGNPLILTTSVAIAKRSEKVLENAIAVAKLRKEDSEATDILRFKKTTLEEAADRTKKLKDEEDLRTKSIKTQLEILNSIGKTAEAQRLQEDIEEAERDERIRKLLEEVDAMEKLKNKKVELFNTSALLVNVPSGAGSVEEEEANLRSLEMAKRTDQLMLQSKVYTASAIKDVLDAMYTFGGQRSRALFNIVKAASIAEATMKTYQAANQVLADPTLPYFAKGPAMFATIAAGLANVARISATQFGGGGGGGGGGSVGGAGGGGTPIGGSLREPTPSRVPLEVTVNIHGNVIGQEAWINDELIPSIEEAVRNERSDLALKQK